MPLATTHRPIAASLVPDWVQAEDDGSTPLANVTEVTTSTSATIQANGTIGDGPFGGTSGDFDAFRVKVRDGGDLVIDIDAQILGSGLNAVIEVFDHFGAIVGSNDDESGVGLDPFLSLSGLTADNYTVIVKGLGSFIDDRSDSGSGSGAGSTGAYRIFITNHLQLAGNPRLFHGDNTGTALSGFESNDILVGNRGDDTINGAGGDDLFVWSAGDGNDSVNGGDGFDVQEVNASNNAEAFSLTDLNFLGVVALGGTGVAGGDLFMGFTEMEGLDLRAFGGNDTFDVGPLVANLTGPIKFWGGDGDDTLNGANAVNAFTASGDAGNDSLTGGTITDTLLGGVGNDRLFGVGGKDVLNGGSGNDLLRGGAGADALAGGSGIDIANYAGSAAVIVSLITGTGARGDAGGDTLAGIENLSGSSNADVLRGNAAANALEGAAGNDILRGEAGNDSLTGGGGRDTMDGGAGNDILRGRDGNDTLIGGAGRDQFFGDAGADKLIFSALGDSVRGANRDQIRDFSHAQGDTIVLTAIDADVHLGGNQAFKFIGAQQFHSTPQNRVYGELRFANHILQGDVNGDGRADFEIFVNANALVAGPNGDFLL